MGEVGSRAIGRVFFLSIFCVAVEMVDVYY